MTYISWSSPQKCAWIIKQNIYSESELSTGQKRLSSAQLSPVIEIIIQDFSAFFKFIVLIVLGEFSYDTSTCTSVSQWRFVQCLQVFSATKSLRKLIFSSKNVSIYTRFNDGKFEFIWLNRLKTTAKIYSETRGLKRNNNLRVLCLSFIFLQMCVTLEKTIYSRLVADT